MNMLCNVGGITRAVAGLRLKKKLGRSPNERDWQAYAQEQVDKDLLLAGWFLVYWYFRFLEIRIIHGFVWGE